MKRSIPEATLKQMWALSNRGVGDKEIGKQFGFGTNKVAMGLARVAPDGRVMESQYGNKRNDPRHVRSGCSVGLVDEIPTGQFFEGRKRRFV